MERRWYQEEGIAKTLEALQDPKRNPVINHPTGAGKSYVIARLVQALKPARMMILAHRSVLLTQDAAEVRKMNPEISVGFYSDSIGEKNLATDVIVAGISSIANVPEESLPAIDYIFIDEAHLVNNEEIGQYRTLINKLQNKKHVAVIGLSATPYRVDGGYIHKGKNSIFTDIVHEVSAAQLIEEGYLCPIASKDSAQRVDISNLHTRMGEFVHHECDALFNQGGLVRDTVLDMLSYAKDRKSWMIFCASVDHAHAVCRELWKHGVSAVAVDGKTPQVDREMAEQQFREGKIQALLNYNIYTEGFNAPNVDFLVLLCTTNSPGRYVQMVGRGLRKHPDKQNCLVLDYGQNAERFGPLRRMTIEPFLKKAKGETLPFKVCPWCREVIDSKDRTCPECEYEFPVVERKRTLHNSNASDFDLLHGKTLEDKFDGEQILQVIRHSMSIHNKMGAPPSIRIDYYLDMLNKVSEWVCPEHTGFAKKQATDWWKNHTGNDDTPETAQELYDRRNEYQLADKIVVELKKEFPKIVKRFFKKTILGGLRF